MAYERSRREFLFDTLKATSLLAIGPSLINIASPTPARAGTLSNIGPLRVADANGVMLPAGFTSRIIARSGQAVTGSSYIWHDSPDGGATFATPSGGWVYTSNSEVVTTGGGGVGAIEFNASGQIIGARSLLRNSTHNCAGGPSPWGTWMSCEERELGVVWETFPLTNQAAVRRPALGLFPHEAVAFDTVAEHVYMTEDQPNGCFYRFIPTNGFPNLTAGTLQVARRSSSGAVTWLNVPTPNPVGNGTRTRDQVAGATRFNGGEGIWYHDGLVYFTTKGDNRVWMLDTQTQILTIFYDDNTSSSPILTGVDNVTVSASGDVLVAEDGGNLQICVLDQTGVPKALMQLSGQAGSEITGPAINPAGTRLYFSSQRGLGGSRGITYELTGRF